MSKDTATLVAFMSSVVVVVIINLIMTMMHQDYRRLDDTDHTVLFVESVLFDIIVFLCNLLYFVLIHDIAICILSLVLTDASLLVFNQLCVSGTIETAKINYLSDDDSHDQREKRPLVMKTVNELLLMKCQDNGGEIEYACSILY